jgi:hypothetical protein
VRFNPVCISNFLDSYQDLRTYPKDFFGNQIRSWSSSTMFNLLLIEQSGSSTYISGATSNTLYTNTVYYVKITKSGTSLTQVVDNDSDFSSPVTSYSMTLHANHNFKYIMFPTSANMNTPAPSSGYMEYLWFGETEGGYASEGYMITDDLLQNHTHRGPFSLIYNASIPSANELNVSVSQDGSSWNLTGDHDEGGCLVSCLEPFNWTSLYVKFGFEGDGSDTPILYDYHLTFYEECIGEDGGLVLEFGDLNWILTVIWLALLGVGWGNKINQIKVLGGVFGMVVGIYFMAEDTLIGLIVIFFSLSLFVLAVRDTR